MSGKGAAPGSRTSNAELSLGAFVTCSLAMACSASSNGSSNLARPVPIATSRDTCWADTGGRAPERHWAWERFNVPPGVFSDRADLLLVGPVCKLAPAPPPGTLLGSPNDVHTMPGTHDGYEVRNDCEAKWSGFEFVLHGNGSEKIPAPARAWSDTELERASLSKEACEAAGVRSLHVPRGDHNCRGDIYLALHDWRDLDAAVRGVGSWMKCRSIGGDVVLRVEPVPHPPKLL